MPLFAGEEMVDVPTPDGRTVRMPRSAVPANLLPAGPVPVPITDELAGAPAQPVEQPTSVTGGQLVDFSGSPAQPELVQNGADYKVAAPKNLPTDTAGVKRSNAQYDQKQKKEQAAKAKADKRAAAYAASPAGQLASVQGKQDAAQLNEQDALIGAADLQAAEDATIANAVHDRNEKLDTLFANRQKEMQQAAEEEDAKLNEVVGLRKKIAGTKVDRSLDHPILAAIMAGLAGLGQAMNQKAAGQQMNPTLTLDLLYNAIDRKVAAQMADLDLLGKTYGMTKDELGLLRDKSANKLQMHNTLIAGETDRAVRAIEEITARSASDKTKANAKVMIAQLQQRAADKTMEATRWGLDFDQKDRHHKESVAAQNYATSVQKYGIDTNAQLRREEIWADLQKALAADRAKGDEATFKARLEADKEVRQMGLKGADNDYLLTPEGRAKMASAKALEETAAKMYNNTGEDPATFEAKKAALIQKAAVLRGDARSFNVVMARDPNQAGDMSKKYAAAQTMMDTIDEVKMLYDQAGRSIISKSQLQQELQAKVGLLSVAAKDAWELGAWDKGSAKLVEGIIGSDPTDGLDVGAITKRMGFLVGNDPEGFKSRLDAVTVKLDQDVRQQLSKNSNWDGQGDLFTHKEAPKLDTPNQQSATAVSKGTSAMETDKGIDQGRAAAERITGQQIDVGNRDTTGSLKYPGLSKEQEQPFDELLTRYKRGDRDAANKIVGQIAAESAKRPDLAVPMLHNLKQYAPALYTAARQSVPKGSDVDKQMLYEESLQTGPAMTDSATLATNIVATMRPDGSVTDQDAYNELSKRAGQKDPQARAALMKITAANAARKTARGGR